MGEATTDVEKKDTSTRIDEKKLPEVCKKLESKLLNTFQRFAKNESVIGSRTIDMRRGVTYEDRVPRSRHSDLGGILFEQEKESGDLSPNKELRISVSTLGPPYDHGESLLSEEMARLRLGKSPSEYEIEYRVLYKDGQKDLPPEINNFTAVEGVEGIISKLAKSAELAETSKRRISQKRGLLKLIDVFKARLGQ